MSLQLADANVLVLGQVMTSRTETVEDYLRYRCRKLAVIGLPGINHRFRGRKSLYEGGKLVKENSLPRLYVEGISLYYPRVFLYHLIQLFSIFFSALSIRTRFHFVLGISTFHAIVGILLRQLGFVGHVIYYSIDYYPRLTFMDTLFRILDKICVENSDAIWNLSQSISDTRHANIGRNLKVSIEALVPLTYNAKMLKFRPLNEIERHTIAFVGTLEKMQGLQLLVRAMPEILEKMPNAMVKIIGHGPYADELKKSVRELSLDEHFVFYGFVEKDSDVRDIISRCAIGVAPYVPVPENNAMTADPGKIKLYAFCGLPVIVTRIPSGLLVDREGAGVVIDYDSHELANAIVRVLQDDRTLTKYRHSANLFAQTYTAERVFQEAFARTLQSSWLEG